MTLENILSSSTLTKAQQSEIQEVIAASTLSPVKDADALWDLLRTQVLSPSHPIALHRALCDWCFQEWDEATKGPRPIWRTDESIWKNSNLYALMQEKGFRNYDDAYRWSVENGREFWATMVRKLGIPFKNIYTPTASGIVDLAEITAPKWLPDAQLNISDACFTAPADAVAILYRKEGSPHLIPYTYGALNLLVNRVASALTAHGFSPGDRIAVDMPMNVEAIAIYLGILRMGAVVVCLADSFKGLDLDIRIEVVQPVKAIFTQDATGGSKPYPLYSEVIKAQLIPPAIVLSSGGMPARLLRDGDMTWEDFLFKGTERFESVVRSPEDDCVILFSSSTTSPKEKPGDKPKPPKAIPWRAHTAIKSAADAHLHHDLKFGKTLCWPTNLGWMMGSFAIFGAFINQATLAVFDGPAVSADFVDFVRQAKVNVLGLVPTIAEGWEQRKLTDACDWRSVARFSSTGSPSNPKNYFYLMSRVPGYAPVFEYMGGTEIGGGYLIGSVFHNASPGCFTTPSMGTELFLNDGRLDAPEGEAFIVMRSGPGECPPMGLSTTLLNFDNREKYFERNLKHPDTGALLREHGDVVMRHANGFYTSGGRADDGMNLNGIKTSSLDIENYIKDARISGLREVAAVGVRPPEGGEDWLVIYGVGDKTLNKQELFPLVREAIKARNPQLAKVHDVVVIDALPLTASGKLRRRYLQDSYLEQTRKAGKRL